MGRIAAENTFIALQFRRYQNNITDAAVCFERYQFLGGRRNDRNMAQADKS
jgi:hypothetical protein